MTGGNCVRRTNRILYCASYTKDADECSACYANYWYLTSANFKACLPIIPNCLLGSHVAIYPGTSLQLITCTECAINYLLSTDKLGCNPVTTPIANC